MSTIRKRGDKWQAIVRLKRDGALIHQEAKTFATERLARDWARRVEVTIKDKGVTARQRSLVTLGELITEYQKVREELKPLRRTAVAELSQLHAALGSVSCGDLTPRLFTDFARRRRQEGAGPTTVLHNLSVLRSVLRSAQPMFGYDIDASAVSQAITALKVSGHVAKSATRDRRPSQDELGNLAREFRRIAAHPGTVIPMETIIDLAVQLPRRLGELMKMEWSDYSGTTIILRDTKHPVRPRTEVVPVPPRAKAIIDALPKIDARILPYKSDSVSASFERACKRLSIDDLRFHDLRHEGISRLFEFGLSIQEVALISGHSSWNMLRRYTHLKPTDIVEKLNVGR